MNTPYFNNFMPQPGQFGMPQMQAPQQMNQIQFVNGICSNAYENAQLINQMNVNQMQNANQTQMAMMNGFNGVNSSLCQGFGGVQESINNLSHQMEQCCCNLKTQMMQDKYDALKTQYDQSLQAISNSVQTQNILSQLGRYYTNPPYYPQYGTYYPTGATVA